MHNYVIYIIIITWKVTSGYVDLRYMRAVEIDKHMGTVNMFNWRGVACVGQQTYEKHGLFWLASLDRTIRVVVAWQR